MYTMVLMMAMSGPAETPSFFRSNCGGCGGCVGAPAGCAGRGGFGYCDGQGGRRWGLGLFGGIFKFGGGCCGYQPVATCHGCGSCHGFFAAAPVYYGFAGCYGSCFGSYTNYFSYWSVAPRVHYGHGMPMHVAPPADVTPAVPAPAPEPKKKEAAPAKVMITLPENAILFANGHQTKQGSAVRRFVTPELIDGQRYLYVFMVEVIEDGKSIRESREVAVYAGREVHVDFNEAFARKSADAQLTASK